MRDARSGQLKDCVTTEVGCSSAFIEHIDGNDMTNTRLCRESRILRSKTFKIICTSVLSKNNNRISKSASK